MPTLMSRLLPFVLFLVTASCLNSAKAFSLLGPLKNSANGATDPWQGKPYAGYPGGLGYELWGDIGGPMFLNEAYRWNIPDIYYGFDQSFIEYFGQPGIEAVEAAIAILNALPPVSELSEDLSEFPLNTRATNPEAGNFLDLKSFALTHLLEQLGLANPERFVWGLRQRVVDPDFPDESVISLNYDPMLLDPSPFVNGVYYNYRIFDAIGPGNSQWASAVEWYMFDPPFVAYSSVSGGIGTSDAVLGSGPGEGETLGLWTGQYYTGLTRDDVGGLRFLLSRSNYAMEQLPSGITGAGFNSSNWVNTARRGGVEKLAFRRLPNAESGEQFVTITNIFTDAYRSNEVSITQTLQRVVSHPDILFTAADLDLRYYHFFNGVHSDDSYWPVHLERSDTSRWQNNAAINGQSGAGGPGVIPPGARIAFNRLGRVAFAEDRARKRFANYLRQWASLTDTNSAITPHYGPLPPTELIHLGSRVEIIDGIKSIQSTFHGELGRNYRIETSTNLVNWSVRHWMENPWGIFNVDHPLDEQQVFIRVVRESWPW